MLLLGCLVLLTSVFIVGLHLAHKLEIFYGILVLAQGQMGRALPIISLHIRCITFDRVFRIVKGQRIILLSDAHQCAIAVIDCLIFLGNVAKDCLRVGIQSLVKFRVYNNKFSKKVRGKNCLTFEICISICLMLFCLLHLVLVILIL